jgi:mannose-1-phosphate guanylyltransferase
MGDLAGMVLCAGLGTRLRPLTARAPKPAVPVCGVPLVRWALALLAGAGARRAVVNVHHLPDEMAAAAGDAARALGLELGVSREAVIAGTGGAGLTPWHFSGVHVLSPALLDRVPAEPFEADVNRHVYPPLMASGAIRGHVASGYWNDLGTPERYLGANLDVLSGAVPRARFAGADPLASAAEPRTPGVRIHPSARVDPGARLVGPLLVHAGATIASGAEVGPLAVIGAGATIAAGARVERAVVWDGTVIGAGERLREVIAAGSDRVDASAEA